MPNALTAHVALGNIDRAGTLSDSFIDAGGTSQIAQMVYAAHLVREESWDELLVHVEAHEAVGPLVDGLIAAWAKIGAGQAGAGIEDLRTLAEKPAFKNFATYHLALAHGVVGNHDAVVETLFEGSEQTQTTRRGTLAGAMSLAALDRRDEALSLLNRVFGGTPDAVVRNLRDRISSGEPIPFSIVRDAQEGVGEVYFSVASALKGQTSDAYLLLYARVAQALNPRNSDAVVLSAKLLHDLDQYKLANLAYRQIAPGHAAYTEAELGRAKTLRAWGRQDAAIEVLEHLSRQSETSPAVFSDLGDAYSREKMYAEALVAYDRSLELRWEHDPRRWFIHYTRGIAYERSGAWDHAESDFRQALSLRPNQPQVLNYLGYSLVEKGEKLQEALEMIKLAVNALPENGYIRDSLGWALYRLGRYEEAVTEMEHAVELRPSDPVINDHLGDTYWAVGRHAEARFQWARALSLDPKAEEKPRIERKLSDGLDVVLAEEGLEPIRVADDAN